MHGTGIDALAILSKHNLLDFQVHEKRFRIGVELSFTFGITEVIGDAFKS